MKTARGFSLTELLFGLFLSSILMGGVFHLYLKHSKAFELLQHKLQADIELQWIKEWLSHSIRMAGFTPCVSLNRLNMEALRFPSARRPTFEVMRMGEPVLPIIEVVNSREVVVSSSNAIKASSQVLIADCQHAAVHQVVDVRIQGSRMRVILREPLAQNYHHAFLGVWHHEIWSWGTDGSLYYQVKSKEEVSALIREFSVKPRPGNDHLVDVRLAHANGSIMDFTVAIRA